MAILLAAFVAGCAKQETGADIKTHLRTGQAFFEQGQFNATIIEARAALQIDPNNEEASVLLARVQITLGAPQAALALLERIEGTTLGYFETLSEAYLARGKFASALLLVRQHADVFKQDPVKVELINGEARLGLRDVAEARAAYQRALKIDPGNVDAQIGIITVVTLTGDLEGAEARLKKLLETHPESVDAFTLLGAVYVRQGRYDDAESALTDAVSRMPSTDRFTRKRVVLIQNLIRLLARQGRSGEALFYQEMLADAFPNAEGMRDKMSEVI
ncbi:MAG: tetratricopeptide repeat protein, partial [Pseudomonadales bacterium]|nr:tetratricopeptide repeat protein [Pseudomonadales bacterium]